MKRMSQSLICRIKIIFFQENIEQIRQSNARTIVHRFIQIAYLKTVYAIFGLQNDGDMWEIGSLLSLIIQGRKIEFDSVASDYSYAGKLFNLRCQQMGFHHSTPISLCPSTDTRSSIQSETFRHTIPCFSYLRSQRKRRANTPSNCTPRKRVNGAISLDYAPFIDNEQRQEGLFYRAILASSRQHIC